MFVCVCVCVCVVDVVTWSTDSVGVQGLVFPDGLVGGGVQHGPHHLVKALVGVPLQGARLFPVDQTPAKTYRGGGGVTTQQQQQQQQQHNNNNNNNNNRY